MATPGPAQGAPDNENDEPSYYDVMMIGRTGRGKSTVANKLIGVDPDKKSLLEYDPETGEGINDVIRRWECNEDDEPFFETGDGIESVTKCCKVLSNEISMNRVLDTIGFADAELTRKYGVIQSNIQSFRRILQVQRQCELRFSRVVYFFPNRGPAERADGTLQEEIKIMHSYFGKKIFNIMVIVTTNDKDERYQDLGFRPKDIENTKKVFMAAFEKISQERLNPCPPVIYVPFNATHKVISDSIVGALVISDAEKLVFSPEFPIAREKQTRVTLDFENRCTRCAMKIVYQKLENGLKLPVSVVAENGDVEEYDNSYCHPLFIPKHSKFVRFVGGIGHIMTLGTFKLVQWLSNGSVTFWPGFFDGKEMCINCKKPPGSHTCCAVNQFTEVNGERRFVNHTTELDRLVEVTA